MTTAFIVVGIAVRIVGWRFAIVFGNRNATDKVSHLLSRDAQFTAHGTSFAGCMVIIRAIVAGPSKPHVTVAHPPLWKDLSLL